MNERRRPRILVVEDDELLQRSLTRLLQRRLHADVTVLDGSLDALALVQRGTTFDLAVIDLELPEMDGAQLIDRLAEVAPELPAGLWSSSIRLFEQTTRAAFTVSKTQPVGDLLAAVDRLLARRRPMDSTVVPRGSAAPEPADGTHGR